MTKVWQGDDVHEHSLKVVSKVRLSKRFEKTVTIPVKIQNGQVTLLYGNQLPPIYEVTEGKLVVPADAIADQKWEALLSLTVTVQFRQPKPSSAS